MSFKLFFIVVIVVVESFLSSCATIIIGRNSYVNLDRKNGTNNVKTNGYFYTTEKKILNGKSCETITPIVFFPKNFFKRYHSFSGGSHDCEIAIDSTELNNYASAHKFFQTNFARYTNYSTPYTWGKYARVGETIEILTFEMGGVFLIIDLERFKRMHANIIDDTTLIIDEKIYHFKEFDTEPEISQIPLKRKKIFNSKWVPAVYLGSL